MLQQRIVLLQRRPGLKLQRSGRRRQSPPGMRRRLAKRHGTGRLVMQRDWQKRPSQRSRPFGQTLQAADAWIMWQSQGPRMTTGYHRRLPALPVTPLPSYSRCATQPVKEKQVLRLCPLQIVPMFRGQSMTELAPLPNEPYVPQRDVTPLSDFPGPCLARVSIMCTYQRQYSSLREFLTCLVAHVACMGH